MHQNGKMQLYYQHQIGNVIKYHKNFVQQHIQRQNYCRAKYKITCPGCLKRYVGKTDHCFHIRMNEHGRNCSYFQELGQLYSLSCDDETVNIDIKKHLINAVLYNCRIIDQNNNWSLS